MAPAGFAGPGTPEVQDALRLSLGWHGGGMEGAAQLGAVVNAVLAVRRRPGPPRARLPDRHRGVGPGQRGGRASASAGGGGGGAPPDGRLAAVVDPVPVVLGRVLAGDARPPPLPRVRHHARAAGDDRDQRPPQRGAQPEGRLPRPDDPRRLLRVADDHHAVPAVRLRRAGRRLDRGRSCRPPSTPAPSTTRWPGSRPWAPPCGAGRRGTSSTT